ncbi:hypothetical protein ABEP71_19140 [Bacillus velezensis]
MKKESPQERVYEAGQFYGVKALNLVIERHILSEDKRRYFAMRYVEVDPQKEKEYTEIMDNLSQTIYNIDKELNDIGIDNKTRLQLLRDIKRVYPDGEWLGGLSEEW